jgi:hypothetical protein
MVGWGVSWGYLCFCHPRLPTESMFDFDFAALFDPASRCLLVSEHHSATCCRLVPGVMDQNDKKDSDCLWSTLPGVMHKVLFFFSLYVGHVWIEGVSNCLSKYWAWFCLIAADVRTLWQVCNGVGWTLIEAMRGVFWDYVYGPLPVWWAVMY